jgi:hypothetical protein
MPIAPSSRRAELRVRLANFDTRVHHFIGRRKAHREFSLGICSGQSRTPRLDQYLPEFIIGLIAHFCGSPVLPEYVRDFKFIEAVNNTFPGQRPPTRIRSRGSQAFGYVALVVSPEGDEHRTLEFH